MKNKAAANRYADLCAFPEVCKYAEVDTEHAHQTALFMWAARANAIIDKTTDDRNRHVVRNTILPECNWFSQIYEWRGLSVQQICALKLMFAIPNGGERAAPVAARMKAEGVKSGVSDLFLPVPMYVDNTGTGTNMALIGCGLFLEMKRPEIREAGAKAGSTRIKQAGGTVAPEQEAWFKAMKQNGYKCAVAWTFLEALDRIWEYFNANG